MNENKKELIGNNPKIDIKVISEAVALMEKLPGTVRPKQGADYRISPPLGGEMLTILHCGSKSSSGRGSS